QCAIDKQDVDGGVTFLQCPVDNFNEQNNYLTQQSQNGVENFTGARLDPDVTLSHTPIWVNNICRFVDARGISASLFVPFGNGPSSTDWSMFVTNAPSGVHLAQCCLPRAMKVSDVPVPSETCSTGWVFQGLADPNDTTKLLATPNPDGSFSLVSGVSENHNYP